jgi:hypothetical protein
MGVQGAKPPAGARGVPAFSPFPKMWGDGALAHLEVHRKDLLS